MNRMYCTVREVLDDLELNGVRSEASLYAHIQTASEWIDRNIGQFIPVTATRNFTGEGKIYLFIDPLLAITSIVDDGTTLAAADYILLPRNKHWEDGPYTYIETDPDGARSVFTANGLIAIAGKWGKYNLSKATGATLGAAITTTSAVSLLASDGSLISPGMVCLIDTEQVLATAAGAWTDSTANLGAAITDTSGESITLTDGTKVNVGEIIKIDLEQMKVTSVTANVAGVIRGWNDTTRATHLIAADVYVQRTYTIERGCNGTTAATHLISAPISRYCPPQDINWLCREIAGLAMKKAKSGYAGKVGNAETGEVFYVSEFPQETIKKIKRAYTIQSESF